jgi:hypothetical protein
VLLPDPRHRGDRLRGAGEQQARRGDYAGALVASKNAKTWCWVAFGLGAVFGVLYFAVSMLGFVGEMAKG